MKSVYTFSFIELQREFLNGKSGKEELTKINHKLHASNMS